MLTPEPKVWEVLKKVKKNWSHELKCATSYYYKNVSHQGERRTKNHGTADVKCIHYASSIRTTTLE